MNDTPERKKKRFSEAVSDFATKRRQRYVDILKGDPQRGKDLAKKMGAPSWGDAAFQGAQWYASHGFSDDTERAVRKGDGKSAEAVNHKRAEAANPLAFHLAGLSALAGTGYVTRNFLQQVGKDSGAESFDNFSRMFSTSPKETARRYEMLHGALAGAGGAEFDHDEDWGVGRVARTALGGAMGYNLAPASAHVVQEVANIPARLPGKMARPRIGAPRYRRLTVTPYDALQEARRRDEMEAATRGAPQARRDRAPPLESDAPYTRRLVDEAAVDSGSLTRDLETDVEMRRAVAAERDLEDAYVQDRRRSAMAADLIEGGEYNAYPKSVARGTTGPREQPIDELLRSRATGTLSDDELRTNVRSFMSGVLARDSSRIGQWSGLIFSAAKSDPRLLQAVREATAEYLATLERQTVPDRPKGRGKMSDAAYASRITARGSALDDAMADPELAKFLHFLQMGETKKAPGLVESARQSAEAQYPPPAPRSEAPDPLLPRLQAASKARLPEDRVPIREDDARALISAARDFTPPPFTGQTNPSLQTFRTEIEQGPLRANFFDPRQEIPKTTAQVTGAVSGPAAMGFEKTIGGPLTGMWEDEQHEPEPATEAPAYEALGSVPPPTPSQLAAPVARAAPAAASASPPPKQEGPVLKPRDINMPRTDDMSSATIVQTFQDTMRDYGIDPGPSDGVLGPLTQRGLRAFQGAMGLPETGRVDARTSKYLLRLKEGQLPPEIMADFEARLAEIRG